MASSTFDTESKAGRLPKPVRITERRQVIRIKDEVAARPEATNAMGEALQAILKHAPSASTSIFLATSR